jgi:hypothetical protein
MRKSVMSKAREQMLYRCSMRGGFVGAGIGLLGILIAWLAGGDLMPYGSAIAGACAGVGAGLGVGVGIRLWRRTETAQIAQGENGQLQERSAGGRARPLTMARYALAGAISVTLLAVVADWLIIGQIRPLVDLGLGLGLGGALGLRAGLRRANETMHSDEGDSAARV